MRQFKKSNFQLSSSPFAKELSEEDVINLKQYLVNLDSDVAVLYDILHGNMSLGTTTNLKPGNNLFGQWVTIADSGTINTQLTVPHTLQAQGIALVPGNYFVTSISKGGVVYKDPAGTAWTSSNVYFKCSVANAAINIFLTR